MKCSPLNLSWKRIKRVIDGFLWQTPEALKLLLLFLVFQSRIIENTGKHNNSFNWTRNYLASHRGLVRRSGLCAPISMGASPSLRDEILFSASH
jgi:hypothetical protein